jgi:hypothetical protein
MDMMGPLVQKAPYMLTPGTQQDNSQVYTVQQTYGFINRSPCLWLQSLPVHHDILQSHGHVGGRALVNTKCPQGQYMRLGGSALGRKPREGLAGHGHAL